MKKLFYLSLLMGILATSCSKKDNQTKQNTPTGATILVVTLPDSVKIGSQWWTSVNYNGAGGVNYKNSTTNNPSWGKLYTNKEIASMVIPKGWHIPTTADFNTLMQSVGGISTDPKTGNNILGPTEASKLMSKTEWIDNIGTNSTGFNAVPAGFEYNEYNAFAEAAEPGAKYVEAGFATSSVYTGDRGGIANFSIYQNANDIPLLTTGGITSFSPAGGTGEARSSVRFVRNN